MGTQWLRVCKIQFVLILEIETIYWFVWFSFKWQHWHRHVQHIKSTHPSIHASIHPCLHPSHPSIHPSTLILLHVPTRFNLYFDSDHLLTVPFHQLFELASFQQFNFSLPSCRAWLKEWKMQFWLESSLQAIAVWYSDN